MRFLLDTGAGMLLLTLVACAFVIAATAAAATLVLAAVVEAVRLGERLRRR